MNKSLYIPFEGARLIAAEYDGQVYVAMRPIVEALQMSWPTQRNKLQKNVKKYGCILMNTPTSRRFAGNGGAVSGRVFFGAARLLEPWRSGAGESAGGIGRMAQSGNGVVCARQSCRA